MLTTGTILGSNWRIQSYLGEGACAKVYTVTSAAGQAVDYELVAKVIPLPTGAPTSKTYKEQSRICNTLFYEYTLYSGLLASSPFCPRRPSKFYGEDAAAGVRYLVMERLEYDLTALANNPSLTISQVAKVGQQIMGGLEWLHQRHFLFIDIKPDNFMVKGDQVYFVDFGLVERNSLNNGKPASFAGTPSYSSLAVHSGANATFKDEIESLGYVLLSMFMGGQLPWASATSFEETRRIKASADIRALCIQYNCEEVAEVILTMRNADGGQRPPYPFIHSLLQSMADKNVLVRAPKTGKGVKRSEAKAPLLSPQPQKKADKKPSPVKVPRAAKFAASPSSEKEDIPSNIVHASSSESSKPFSAPQQQQQQQHSYPLRSRNSSSTSSALDARRLLKNVQLTL